MTSPEPKDPKAGVQCPRCDSWKVCHHIDVGPITVKVTEAEEGYYCQVCGTIWRYVEGGLLDIKGRKEPKAVERRVRVRVMPSPVSPYTRVLSNGDHEITPIALMEILTEGLPAGKWTTADITITEVPKEEENDPD